MTWEIPAAAFLHAVVFAVMFLMGNCGGAKEPLFKPEDAMIVQMAGPLKAEGLPQLASRLPPPPKGSTTPTPTAPPPPNPSDLAFQTKDAPEEKGDPKADAKRQALIDEMRRAAALQDLSAPIGTEDRVATSPDGSAEGGTGTGISTDPVMGAWSEKAKKAIEENWHPLASWCQSNSKLKVDLKLSVRGDGTQGDEPAIAKASGNVSFDESARRAAQQTAKLPPLPTKYAGGIGLILNFDCHDAQ